MQDLYNAVVAVRKVLLNVSGSSPQDTPIQLLTHSPIVEIMARKSRIQWPQGTLKRSGIWATRVQTTESPLPTAPPGEVEAAGDKSEEKLPLTEQKDQTATDKTSQPEPATKTTSKTNDTADSTCPICLKDTRKPQLRRLPCNHVTCRACVVDFFRSAISAKHFITPACGLCAGARDGTSGESRMAAGFPVHWAKEVLRPREWTRYRDRLDELAENRSGTAVRCHSSECKLWIPPRHRAKGRKIAVCKCKVWTCMACMEEAHDGETCEAVALERKKAEEAMEALRDEAEKARKAEEAEGERMSLRTMSNMGCRKCPRCKIAIDKNGGCSQMQ
ncbi:IBR domain-containing protein [Colletotrichum musicola]|uniref:RBR-type E3 ubiquitin transferase n=1 Tax=Colletotrichum musicola TaxID=2175873 RepID=A0A8H6NYG4_9PEZI|nr:IBR domain-containing protein [Colletotrichum musicola]